MNVIYNNTYFNSLPLNSYKIKLHRDTNDSSQQVYAVLGMLLCSHRFLERQSENVLSGFDWCGEGRGSHNKEHI